MFDGVNQVFSHSMAQLHAVGNVIQATNAPGVLTTFQVCDADAPHTHEGTACVRHTTAVSVLLHTLHQHGGSRRLYVCHAVLLVLTAACRTWT